MTKQESIEILSEYQLYRRGWGRYRIEGARFPFSELDVTLAIDHVLYELTKDNED